MLKTKIEMSILIVYKEGRDHTIPPLGDQPAAGRKKSQGL